MNSKSTSRDKENPARCDVLVIGGGPAGSTLSSILAKLGWDVVVLEKAHHPRFHIGESLLPMNLEIFESLGVLDKVQELGVIKRGAEFNTDEQVSRQHTFYFNKAMNKQAPKFAYQVRRSEFDHMLLKNSADKGVRVYEGVCVERVDIENDDYAEVVARDEQGIESRWEARFIVDASGRDTLLARQFGIKEKNPYHNSAAIFGHFENVIHRTGNDAGNISIYWFEHGWFWMIPLKDGVMSVGAVCFPEYLKKRTTPPETFFRQTLELCPEVQVRMKDARLVGEVNATGNFSYSARCAYGNRYLLIGDAFAFVDPVFSSGVYLAMSGAVSAASAVNQCLQEPQSSQRVLAAYERKVRRGVGIVSWFIYRFNTPAMRNLFMSPRNTMRIEEAVVSVLAGDFHRRALAIPVRLFKLIYYISYTTTLRAGWASYRRRRLNAGLLFTGGTTPQDGH